MSIAVTIAATKDYTYACGIQARRVQAATRHIPEGHIILVGDKSKELRAICELYKSIMPKQGDKKWEVHLLAYEGMEDNHVNYLEAAQLRIGALRQAAFTKARELGVDRCLSLDSDVLPPAHAVRCMEQMLEFDNGYYAISTCTYPSQGGGGFLGGRGTPQRQIQQDWYEDERDIPQAARDELKTLRDEMTEFSKIKEPTAENRKAFEAKAQKLGELEKSLEKYPPKGNVWQMNALHWRPRGWLDNAYPAIGRGAVLPSDWCGFGCTMMNSEALAFAQFDGYDGKGTEDLYVVWNRWHQRGLRICVIPHCLCDHVIRDKHAPGKFIQVQPYHETDGECIGHLRLRYRPFYNFEPGEKFDPKNDGKLSPPPEQLAAQPVLVSVNENRQFDALAVKKVGLKEKL